MVLRNKFKADGSSKRRKARLVAQGFNQKPGIHFKETFAPVARLGTIRMATALAARYGMVIEQLDIASAYLQGKLDETIFMEPPEQLEGILELITEDPRTNADIREKAKKMLKTARSGNKVCLLKKSLYGIVKNCLGIEFSVEEDKIILQQRGYIRELLNRFGMAECKPISTPMDLGTKLQKPSRTENEEAEKLPYREPVGALTYLSVATRPDIAFSSGLPNSFWAEAVNTSNFVRNICPTTSLNGKTPYEVLFGKTARYDRLRQFGSRGYALNKDPARFKSAEKSEECIFVGYSSEVKGYRVYFPKQRRVAIVRDVRFTNRMYSSSTDNSDSFYKENSRSTDYPILHEEVRADNGEDGRSDNSEITVHQEKGRAAGRPRLLRTGKRGRPRKIYHQVNEADVSAEREEWAMTGEISVEEALSGSNSEEWMDAIVDETKSILKNNTWEMVDRKVSDNVIGSRYVLRNKYNADGSIQKRKARLVAKGFSQRPHIDFNDTSASRMLADMSKGKNICALRKSLYGLKQASRQ
ncbi:UNVERIFIED_CONTAM: hypothetical protein PYX00_009677 [Menopon gallinae]|uniref:Reverse transcriptase Ty1/copia-type domain-containing protein n=1 Tax=Menopon gallinae TaxID=328185 RepID=A0AAW2HC94_9NEOP